MNNPIVGYHIQAGVSPWLNDIAALKPALVTVVDPQSGEAEQIKNASPNTKIVGRVYKPDEQISAAIEASPRDAALWAYDLIAPVAEHNQQVDWWQFTNEVQQVGVDQLRRNAQFHYQLIDRLQAIGARATIANFSRGNPRVPGEDPAYWATQYDIMRYAKGRGGLLWLHQYGYAPIGHDASWLLRRYEERVHPHLPDDLKDMPWGVGEWGCDMGNGTGWRMGYGGDAARYVDDMVAESRRVKQSAAGQYCVGLCIFTLGHYEPWGSFDIAGDVVRLMPTRAWPSVATSTPSPPTPTPNVDEWAMRRGREIATISVAPGTALFDAIIRDGWLPNSPEVYEHGPDGRLYVLRSGESPDGQRKATYFALSGDWDNVRKVEA